MVASCKQEAPFFAGTSEKACQAYGGTFCPTVNCTDLKTCIDDQKTWALDNSRPMFYEYLNQAPTILLENVTDPLICGKARAFFGYDESFVNDKQICADIEQVINYDLADILSL